MLILPVGEDDLQRITSDTRIIAVDMPNTQQPNAQPWYDYRTSVDEIEAVTGLDFFNGLPVALQASLEAGVDGGGGALRRGRRTFLMNGDQYEVLEAARGG